MREARQAGVTDTDMEGALQRLRRGLAKAWELCSDRDALADRLPSPANMRFDGLRRRLSSSNSTSVEALD